MLYTVETYLLLFFIYSIGGWLMEVIISNVNITSKKIKDNTEEITGEIAEEITEKVKAILENMT